MSKLLEFVIAVAVHRKSILVNPNDWDGMVIECQPLVHRFFRRMAFQGAENFVFIDALGRVSTQPCLHQHPWSSASLILDGQVEMLVGEGIGGKPPGKLTRLLLEPGDRYTISTPDIWHSMRPLAGRTLQASVIGPRVRPASFSGEGPLWGLSSEADKTRVFAECVALPEREWNSGKLYQF